MQFKARFVYIKKIYCEAPIILASIIFGFTDAWVCEDKQINPN